MICIVDDNSDYRYLIRFMFEKYLPACSTRFFTCGKSFLEELSTFEVLPGIIFLDYHMPNKGGKETLTYLKEHRNYRDIPVVVMSAYATDLEISKIYELGAKSFIRKGDNFHSVKSLVANLCG